MARNWMRWMGLFLLLGTVVILSQGGCLDMSSKTSDNTGDSGGGTNYSYYISGRVLSNSGPLQNVVMTMGGAMSNSTSTDMNGNYTFLVNNGNYIITPSLSGYSFSPGSMALSINGSNWSGVNFTASTSAGGSTYTISGNISGGVGSGATVMLNGPSSASTMTDGIGNYTFPGLVNGNYTISASKPGFTITPNSQNVSVSSANRTGINFTGSTYGGTTYTISGRVVTNTSAGVGDVMMTLNGSMYLTINTNPDGYFTFFNVQNGSYTLTPNKMDYYFAPSSISLFVNNSNMVNQDFTATQAVANTYGIYGQLNGDGNVVGNQTVNLSGTTSRSTVTDFSGFYSFEGLTNGTYTVDPAVTTVPDNRSVTINNADSYGNNFDVATTFSISGNITYSGFQQGVMFVFVVWDNSGLDTTEWGTAIAWMGPPQATRSYTVRGVRSGNYKIFAMLDTSIGNFNARANANDPSGVSGSIALNANYINANVTVADAGAVTAAAPTNVMAIPGAGGFMLFWDTPVISDTEAASAYNIYYGTNPAITPTVPSSYSTKVQVPAKDDAHYFKGGLTDATDYYFVLESVSNSVTSSPTTVISTTIGAQTGGYTVSGTVTLPTGDPGIVGKWLYVGAYAEDKNNLTIYTSGYQIPAGPPATIDYSIPGVVNGAYMLFMVIDMNGDGVINSNDYQNTNGGNMDMVMVNNASLTKNVTVPSSKVVAYVQTNHHRDMDYGDNYSVNVSVVDGKCTPITVTLLSGPNVFGPTDLAKEWEFRSWIDFRSARPNIGDTYTLDVGFANVTSETVTASVTGVIDNFAGSLNVTSGVTPTFSWAAPTSAPAVYSYRIRVEEEFTDGYGWTWSNYVWETWDNLPSTQTSIVFNDDTRASISALVSGHTYRWSIAVQDSATGNSSNITTRFVR
ncbi:MAG: carboxypeptidase regulatory-like domain-containing protein [Candidatus Brocadiia bacterium]